MLTYLVKDYLISTLENSISQSEEFIDSINRILSLPITGKDQEDYNRRKKSELNDATNRLQLKRRALEEVNALKTS